MPALLAPSMPGTMPAASTVPRITPSYFCVTTVSNCETCSETPLVVGRAIVSTVTPFSLARGFDRLFHRGPERIVRKDLHVRDLIRLRALHRPVHRLAVGGGHGGRRRGGGGIVREGAAPLEGRRGGESGGQRKKFSSFDGMSISICKEPVETSMFRWIGRGRSRQIPFFERLLSWVRQVSR